MNKIYKRVTVEIRDQIYTRSFLVDGKWNNGVVYPVDLPVARIYEVEDPDLIDKTGEIITHDFPLCNVIEITVENIEDEDV